MENIGQLVESGENMQRKREMLWETMQALRQSKKNEAICTETQTIVITCDSPEMCV